MSEAIVGVDLGGSAIKFGISTREGAVLELTSVPTMAHLGPDSVIERLEGVVSELCQKHNTQVIAIGVGVPGLVDLKTGETRFLPNLPTKWIDVPIGNKLSSKFKCPVLVANDARTAALGELKFGFGRDKQSISFAFFTLGTGVGGGVVIDGKLRLGTLGAAGELGHQTIHPDGLRCGCGNFGCLETIASGPAILAAVYRVLKSGQAPRLHDHCHGDFQNVTIEMVSKVIEEEESVREVVLHAAKAIGIASANVVNALHPDMIILGGGVAEIGDILSRTIYEEIRKRVCMFPIDSIEVRKSELGNKAGVLGGIGLGQMALENETL